MVKSEGRFTEGPVMSIATAAPIGAPAESRINANGISKNVGIASGIAIRATTTIATICPFVEARVPTGSHSAIAIETTTPMAINGTVRTATCKHDRRNLVSTGRVLSSSLVGQSIGLTVKSLSIRIPVKNTATAATARRVKAINLSEERNKGTQITNGGNKSDEKKHHTA